MNFDRVCDVLKEYVLAHNFLASMMKAANMLVLVCMILRTVNLFVSVDAIITTIVFYLFLLTLVLLLASKDYVFLTIGLWWQTAIVLIGLIQGLSYGYYGGTWVVAEIMNIAVYFVFAYLATQKAGLISNSSQRYTPPSQQTPLQYAQQNQSSAAPQQMSADATSFCANCGTPIAPDATFCIECGTKVS
jgi:hypothetical protein